jgi:ABC-type cobalt transport system substrate-binding protein
MDMLQRIMLGLMILMFIALLILIPFAIKKNADYEVACKEAGGVPYIASRSFNLCLNPTAIVELK